VAFFLVYIKEAHPSNARATGRNARADISVPDHRNYDERAEVAQTSCAYLKISMPTLVDTMDDKTNLAYGAWPDRIYAVDLDGKIAIAAKPGPRGFKPGVEAVSKWLAELPARQADISSGKTPAAP